MKTLQWNVKTFYSYVLQVRSKKQIFIFILFLYLKQIFLPKILLMNSNYYVVKEHIENSGR